MSQRYVRINSLPGFSTVRSYYWFDTKEVKVLSFATVTHRPDLTGVTTDQASRFTIGSRQAGDLRYNFTTHNRCNYSSQLRKVRHAYNVSQVKAAQTKPATDCNVAGCPQKAEANDFFVIHGDGRILRHRNTEAAARKFVEDQLQSGSGSTLYVMKLVATAKNVVKTVKTLSWT